VYQTLTDYFLTACDFALNSPVYMFWSSQYDPIINEYLYTINKT